MQMVPELSGKQLPVDIQAFTVMELGQAAPTQFMSCDGTVCFATGSDASTCRAVNIGPVLRRARQKPKEYAAVKAIAMMLHSQSSWSVPWDDLPREGLDMKVLRQVMTSIADCNWCVTAVHENCKP